MITDVLKNTTVFVDGAYNKVEFTNGMFGLSESFLEYGLGMHLTKDIDDPRLPLEERFVGSKAQVAFVSALPYLFDKEELVDSKILQAKAVILTSNHYDFAELNKSLEKAKFLTMDLNNLSIEHISPLVNLFRKALKNI